MELAIFLNLGCAFVGLYYWIVASKYPGIGPALCLHIALFIGLALTMFLQPNTSQGSLIYALCFTANAFMSCMIPRAVHERLSKDPKVKQQIRKQSGIQTAWGYDAMAPPDKRLAALLAIIKTGFKPIEDLRMIASVEDNPRARSLALRMRESIMHNDSYSQLEEADGKSKP